MKWINVMLKVITSPLDVMREPKAGEILPASVLLAGICAFLDAVLLPASYYLAFRNKYELTLGAGRITEMLLAAFATWFAACTSIWLVSLIFRKGVGLPEIMATWGFSYIPNLFCLIAYGIIQLQVFPVITNPLAAVLVNTLFILLLIWKAIFYFMEMRFVLKLELPQLLLSTLLLGVVFFLLMTVGFSMGLQVPML